MSVYKTVTKAVLSIEQDEGVGARVRRSIGSGSLRNLDPFLMLDEFKSTNGAGFPNHPHRGFETVSYMLNGKMQHEDFAGHKGTIGPGDLQWMTAGRGILHSEMPASDGGHGLQLWVNLPAKDKMMPPRYQELLDKEVPRVTSEDGGATVKVIAGKSYGVDAAVRTHTPIVYLDVRVQKDKVFEQEIPENWTSFIYTLSGDVAVGDGDKARVVEPHTTAVLSGEGDKLIVRAVEDAHFVVIGGQKINEPIYQHGPFVMNTREEIMQAFLDFQMGQNGFEGAHEWKSTI
ncbi:RmlC-like cupin domain-containing protein [Fimicolochytrium jonesii]|uniref:RmlC-like cupin domain-containing protein n=1 Tax=Fimicolochytrium jonesii TaxID=1396493 RepID=UPI0022FE652C|nr:RmlC-like cupin domain-containing protein [Fimicolochytrium jonesii]KAI8822399.1 RmlC-like cupin domain-containing protein [Fimicolochytrium jonesii]